MMECEVKQLTEVDRAAVKQLFKSVFCAPPWNDDWSNEAQLDAYLQDLCDNRNSLSFGLYELGELIGLCLGHTRHWYEGTGYHVDEFCLLKQFQGQGYGKQFFKLIDPELKERKIHHIFLLTERDVPAYEFYQKQGFIELDKNVAFAKRVGF